MEALLASIALVALAEIGDKTQLLAIVLVTRFRRPAPIVAGMLGATLANHFIAALVGERAAAWLDGPAFRYAVAASFVAMAGWALIPDRYEDRADRPPRHGAFVTTLVAFFLVEIGDKTQLATMALAARFHAVLPVLAGSTTGMMLANVPAIYLGQALVERVPLRAVRLAAALLFLALGIWLALVTAGVV